MTTTSPEVYYVIGSIVLILLVVAIFAILQRARSARLQRRFGPEYDRVVRERGSAAEAERELTSRESRVRKLHLAQLPAGARDRYEEEWRQVQARFVDDPGAALRQADALITSVMRDRGYPVADFDQRASDLSADHSQTLEDYRAARAISERNERQTTGTEDLRQAMVHYRTLFNELVGA